MEKESQYRKGGKGVLLLVAALAVTSMLAFSAVAISDSEEFDAETKTVRAGNYVLTYTDDGVSATITGIDSGSGNKLTIPGTAGGLPVKTIGSSAFYNNADLKTVVIPNSVTTIEFRAFMQCESLSSVTIPNSVTSIGGGAFGVCESLESITLPTSVTTIEAGAFSGSDYLEVIVAPDIDLTSAGIPGTTKIVRYNGDLSVSALLGNTEKITLIFIIPEDKNIAVKVGTTSGGNDIATTGSDNLWRFDASSEDEFFLTTTVSDAGNDMMMIYIAIAVVAGIAILAVVYFVFLRKK